MRYSIVFIVEEENGDFFQFFDTILKLIKEKTENFEMLVVANGTDRFIMAQLALLRGHTEKVKVITFQRRVPSSIGVNAILNECSGRIIMLLGATQELDTASYERLISSMTEEVDLVVPYRKLRKSSLFNRLHSKALNTITRVLLRSKLHDIGCNVKLIHREVLESLELYGNMARYFSALVLHKGFSVREIECEESDRIRRTKLYSPRIYLTRLTELLNLFFSTNFSKKPLRFFNLVGACIMLIGMIALLYIAVQKVLFGVPIGARPLLIVGIISLVTGSQLASFGLLGEVVSFVHGRSRKEYTIEKII